MKNRYIILTIVASITVLLSLVFPWYIFLSPTSSYEWITNNKPPNETEIVNSGYEINDNFFHVGYYWEIKHTKSGLKNLLSQLKASTYFEDYTNVQDYKEFDNIWKLPNIENALNKKIHKSSISKGYEVTTNNRRDSILLVNKNGNTSYLEWN